jgi:hypothetical protein
MARDEGVSNGRPLRRPPTIRMPLGHESERESGREGDEG